MKKILTALSLSAAAISFSAIADDAAIINSLKSLGASKVEVKPSPIKGIKTAVTDQGILYASEDGKYVLQGKLFELTQQGAVDVSAKALMGTLESYKNEMIVYPAKQEKYVVTVFMDITCYYCHKLHEQMKEYNDLGITVRYLAFPRKGMDQTAEQMEAIFTAKNSAQALNDAEQGNLPKQLKTPNIVKKHYELGIQLGVRGTPTIVTSSGELIGGYLPPKELLAALEN
ncbi:thiol:disulfide interchange protein DsbC [Pasteurella langaaensis DSM 22999]|uniref:Thiol:disulfide interchange protein n=1 Tax=Alitibacter langaaensis DSM 22999 TaxID=1122935 RepID=A0A2U0SKP4_9PAST|nr:bifunctional protein-disulfide isomerase/oxidoreductase DsbC [Pasteurella langaaensis]PVX31918.1 thiol:disulfide interchange protein DsbC [Pasteurella langaaensis DSM 22999]